MKKIIYILLINIILLNSVAFPYETSRQLKIDSVNAYQPNQFASGTADVKNTRYGHHVKENEAQPLDQVYVDYMSVNSDYVSDSPVAKETEDGPLTIKDMASEPPLEGSVFRQSKSQLTGRQRWDKIYTFVKGKPAPDAVMLGMWSKHMVTKDRNEKNDLVGLQYGGVCLGYFKNSWYKNTYVVSAARCPWSKQFKHDLSIDFQYKIGVMNGYGSHAPLRVGPVEAFLMPMFSFNYKTSGFDLWFVPTTAPVFAISYRFGIPKKYTYESVHARRIEKYPPKPKMVEPPAINQYEQIQNEQIESPKTFITPAM